jgi:septin 7
MTDSYASSRNGDLSPSSNGYVTPSNPSLAATGLATGVTPVIRRKLMGYVGFANFPNQVHRKSVRKGFQFTVMVVGSFFFCLHSHLNVILVSVPHDSHVI